MSAEASESAISGGRARKPVSWVTREASVRDMSGILECRVASFAGEDAEKAEPVYWRWEFVDNHAGPARMFVAVDGDHIVGHYAVIPQRFLLDQELLDGSIVVDVMTHPGYRFQGMFTTLGRFSLDRCAAETQLEFTTGYPIRQEVIPGHLKVGWRIRFKIGTYVMPLSIASLVQARYNWLEKVPLLPTLAFAVPSVFARAWSRAKLRRRGNHRIERLTAVDADRFGRFWDKVRVAPPKRCMVQERTPDYLAWRFDANPSRHYTYHAAVDEAGELRGFLVSRVAFLLYSEAMIVVDACLLPGEGEDTVRALFADVRELALAEDCPMLAMMVTQPNPYIPGPRRLGFVRVPFEFSFITRPLTEQTDSEDDELRWHLMWGDTDDV